MTKKSKSTKKALLLSAGSLMLSCAMLVGTTFAWFSDTVTSGKNKIVAGNLDVELEYWGGTTPLDTESVASWHTVNEDTDLFEDVLWEPGKMYTYTFRVSNAGNLALQYKMNLRKLAENALKEGKDSPTQHSLSEVIKVAFLDVELTNASEQEPFNADNAKPSGAPLESRDAYLDIIKPYTTTESEEPEEKEYKAEFQDLDKASKMGKLLPMPEEGGEVITPDESDDNNKNIGSTAFFDGEETDRKNNWCDAFTMVLYWAPNSDEVDNLYNVNNDKETAEGGDLLVSASPAPGYELEEDAPTDALFIDLGVNLYATQVDYEKDSFDDNYDEISIKDAPNDGSVLVMNGAGYTFTNNFEVPQAEEGDTTGLYIQGSGIVDLNGQTITSPDYGLIFQPDMNSEDKTSNVTLTGDGTITSKENDFVVYTLPGVTLTITGGTYGHNTTDLCVYAQAQDLSEQNVKIAKPAIIINGGTFNGLINLNNYNLDNNGAKYIVINDASGLENARFQQLDKNYIQLNDTEYELRDCEGSETSGGQKLCKIVKKAGN